MDWSIVEQYPNISFWAFASEIESLHQIAVAYRIQSCVSIRQTDYKNAQPETRRGLSFADEEGECRV